MSEPQAVESLPEVAPLRACVLTAPGRGAVATIQVHGDLEQFDRANLFRARNGRPISRQEIGPILFGHWSSPAASEESAPTEEVVACRLDTATVEIHCHGGTAAIERILGDLRRSGAEVLESQEAGWRHPGPLSAACERALLAASTRRAALILMSQHELWTRELDRWAKRTADEIQQRIREIAAWKPFTERLTIPAKIVLCGRPNVGKSSLMNAIAGFARSIVHHVPGTTRDVVTLETAIDGWPVRLSDTAGLRETADPLEAEGVRRTHRAVAEADLVIGLFDLSVPPGPEDASLWNDLPLTALRVGNKSDLPSTWPNERVSALLQVSAATGEGIAALLSEISRRLVPSTPPADLPLPISEEWQTWLPPPPA